MALKVRAKIMEISPYVGGRSKLDDATKKVTKLSSNENALGTSPKAIEAYKKAADKLFRYPDGGSTELRHAIADVYGLDADRIVCGAGSDEIIAFLCAAYAGEGDEVLFTEHGFLMYPISAKRVGATPVTAEETDLHTDVDKLLAKVTERTRIVFIANPNNPTGSYIGKSEVQRLREGLPDDVLLVLDAAYAEYVDEADYEAGRELVDANDNTVMTRTFSKIYGLGSERLGWAYCPPAIADVLNRVRGPFNVTGSAQAAGVAAVYDKEFTEQSRVHNKEQVAWLSEQLTDLGLKLYPSVANFILVDFADEKKAEAVNQYLMSEGIIVRAVANYNLATCLRITIGTVEENQLVVDMLKKFLA